MINKCNTLKQNYLNTILDHEIYVLCDFRQKLCTLPQQRHVYLIVVIYKIIFWIGSFAGVQDDGVGVGGGVQEV